MVQRHRNPCQLVALLGAVAVALVLAMPPVAVAAEAAADSGPAAWRTTIRASLEDLTRRTTAVNRAFEPYRRQVPADPADWQGIQVLLQRVGEVADGAVVLRSQVDTLRGLPDYRPAVRPSELRRRLAVVDSLAAASREMAALAWRPSLPDDAEEARLRVQLLARQARTMAERTAAAAADLAYAVDVTEGINPRAVNLSIVGVLVVFSVLSLIAGVVASIRRLDDGWQQQERDRAAQAVHREPTIDDTTVVLIAAACATLITGRHRVRRIRRLLSPATKRTPWSAQGRLILQGSHTVGRKHN